MPGDNASNQQVSKSQEQSQRTGFTNGTSAQSQEQIADSGSLSLCDLSQRGCTRSRVNDVGVIRSSQRAEGNQHENACRDGGVDGIASQTAEQTLDDDDGKERADQTLPDRGMCGQIQRQKQTGDQRAEVADRLLLFTDQIEQILEADTADTAGGNDGQRTQTEDNGTHHSGGKQSQHHVTHDGGGGATAVNMWGGGKS